MAVLNIDWKNFISGESTNEWSADKGFSPKSYGLNLTKKRGVLYFREASTDLSANLTGNIIASTNDLNIGPNTKYFVDDEGAFYTLDGTTLTKRQTATGTFTQGTTDMVQFKLVTYATSTDRVIELTGPDLAGIDSGWWTGLTSTHRHPIEVVEDEMFVADGNVIYYWNGTSSGTAFTLPTQNKVTTLRKHPDGVTLLAFTGKTDNYSHTLPSAGRVYYCDPSLRDWTREVELNAQVEGTRLVGGQIFATWGNNFGFFDGSGLRLLKKLETSQTTYSHAMTNVEDIIMVRDGLNVLAYGDLGLGNVWWKPYRNLNNSQNIEIIASAGDNKLLVAFDDGATAGELELIDYDNSGFSGAFYTNRTYFPVETSVRKIEDLHEANAAATQITYNYIDTADNSSLIETVDYTGTGATTNKTIVNCDVKTDVFQLQLAPPNDDIGHHLIRLHYDSID